MVEKQIKNTYARLEKVLTLAGLAFIVVACLANAYSVYLNFRFINDPIGAIYYFRNIIILGGGFAIGHLLTKKSVDNSLQNMLFAGVVYAVLASAIYWIVDLIRVDLQNIFGIPPFPWGRIAFEGGATLALIVALVIALISRHKPKFSAVGAVAKIVLIVSFIIYQLRTLIPAAGADFSNASVWLIIAGYLTTPIVIAFIAFVLLKNVKILLDRAFYASFVGVAYTALIYALWDFRTDASSEATNIFSIVVSLISIIATVVLLWHVRRAVK